MIWKEGFGIKLMGFEFENQKSKFSDVERVVRGFWMENKKSTHLEYFWELDKTFPSMASKLYGVNATIIIFVFSLYCIVLYCIVLYCIVLYCIVLYCIVLYCIVLYCIVLYCIVLYCIVLYCIVSISDDFGASQDAVAYGQANEIDLTVLSYILF